MSTKQNGIVSTITKLLFTSAVFFFIAACSTTPTDSVSTTPTKSSEEQGRLVISTQRLFEILSPEYPNANIKGNLIFVDNNQIMVQTLTGMRISAASISTTVDPKIKHTHVARVNKILPHGYKFKLLEENNHYYLLFGSILPYNNDTTIRDVKNYIIEFTLVRNTATMKLNQFAETME